MKFRMSFFRSERKFEETVLTVLRLCDVKSGVIMNKQSGRQKLQKYLIRGKREQKLKKYRTYENAYPKM